MTFERYQVLEPKIVITPIRTNNYFITVTRPHLKFDQTVPYQPTSDEFTYKAGCMTCPVRVECENIDYKGKRISQAFITQASCFIRTQSIPIQDANQKIPVPAPQQTHT